MARITWPANFAGDAFFDFSGLMRKKKLGHVWWPSFNFTERLIDQHG
jgi:hypothetical protein